MRTTFNGKLVDLMSDSQNYFNHRKKIEQIMTKKINPLDIKRVQTLNNLQGFRVKAVSHSIK